MITAKYEFFRDNRSAHGFLSQNRASTDTLNLLNAWISESKKRSYTIQSDEDDSLVATLSSTEINKNSAADKLNNLCNEHGLTRTFLG